MCRRRKNDADRSPAAEPLDAVGHAVGTVDGADADDAGREGLWGNYAAGRREGQNRQAVAAYPQFEEFPGERGVRRRHVDGVGSGVNNDALRDHRIGRGRGGKASRSAGVVGIVPIDFKVAEILCRRIGPGNGQRDRDRARGGDGESLLRTGAELVDVVIDLRVATGLAAQWHEVQGRNGYRGVRAFPIAAVIVACRGEHRDARVLSEKLAHALCVGAADGHRVLIEEQEVVDDDARTGGDELLQAGRVLHEGLRFAKSEPRIWRHRVYLLQQDGALVCKRGVGAAGGRCQHLHARQFAPCLNHAQTGDTLRLNSDCYAGSASASLSDKLIRVHDREGIPVDDARSRGLRLHTRLGRRASNVPDVRGDLHESHARNGRQLWEYRRCDPTLDHA